MTEPAAVLAALDPPLRARLTQRSNRAGLRHLALHLLVIAGLAAYVALGLPLWWLSMFALGIALVFLFTLQHECTHATPFSTPILNDIVGHACAVILVQPFAWFRAFHMAHHRYTNDPDKDPELQGDAKPSTWATFAWHLGTIGYWGGKISTLIQNAVGRTDPTYVTPRAQKRIKLEARILLAVYACAMVFTLTISPILLWIWIIPILLGFPVLRLYLLAEHGRCPNVANMFENSRTTYTSRMIRFLAWNMPYHAEHHAYPNVPFHRLPDMHTIAALHLRSTSNGYSSFARDYTETLT